MHFQRRLNLNVLKCEPLFFVWAIYPFCKYISHHTHGPMSDPIQSRPKGLPVALSCLTPTDLHGYVFTSSLLWDVITDPWTSYQIRKTVETRECREHFSRRRLQRKPLVSVPGIQYDICVTYVSWCMSGSLTRGGGENVPGIPGVCAIRNLRIR